MDAPEARTQFQRDYPAKRFAEAAASLEGVAASITQRQPEPQLVEAMRHAQTLCESMAQHRGADENVRTTFANVARALETWRMVWPRLGRQSEFRQAVIREANLWGRRLKAMADKTA